jgi:rare lipoprotein A
MLRIFSLIIIVFMAPHAVAKSKLVNHAKKEFIQCGKAVWYHTKYQNHRTASGERYNLRGMTAAHKTLPIPSYVRVSNLRNGRQVIVKINDRGPYRTKSIIDLSTAAANKLGISHRETAYVQLEVVNAKSSPSSLIQYLGHCRKK